MQFFQQKTIKKILRSRKKLETKLKVKIIIKANEIELEGKEINKFVAEKVLEALDKNFPIEVSLLLLEPDYVFEEIPIKHFTKKHLADVKSRIIGTRGRTIEILQELSECYITLTENTVNIIGTAEKIRETETAIKSLIHGSKQANVYKFLEKYRNKTPISLGLKTGK